jgi:peptide/nickel transport system permease protein
MALPRPSIQPHRPRISAAVAIVAGFVISLIAIGLFGSDLTRERPDAISLSDRLEPPIGFGGTWSQPLGTDQLGRDVLARVLSGARISLIVAVSATAIAGTIGSTIGLLGGYLGGRLDRATTWLGDVQMAVPFVVVAVAVAASIKPSAGTVVLVLGATGWSTYARVARLAAQPLRHALFVDSARVAGASQKRVVFRHVLPVILPSLLAIAGQQTGAMMLYESALSFLGLGVPAGTITWGSMIADARETAQTAWWATVAPGLAIVTVVFGFNATGAAITRQLTGNRDGEIV